MNLKNALEFHEIDSFHTRASSQFGSKIVKIKLEEQTIESLVRNHGENKNNATVTYDYIELFKFKFILNL